MPEILTVLRRESICLRHYFGVWPEQIFGGRPSFAGLAGRGMSMGRGRSLYGRRPRRAQTRAGHKAFRCLPGFVRLVPLAVGSVIDCFFMYKHK